MAESFRTASRCGSRPANSTPPNFIITLTGTLYVTCNVESQVDMHAT